MTPEKLRDRIVGISIILFNILFWGGLTAFGFGLNFGSILVGISLALVALLVWGGLLCWAVHHLKSIVGWPPTREGLERAGTGVFPSILLIFIWILITALSYTWIEFAGPALARIFAGS